jgi:hypothetical protein
MADPFDEFEFKPLTDGLGFHRKGQPASAPADANVMANVIANKNVNATSSQIPESAPKRFPNEPATRTSNQSISDLMATLPPSFDFQEDAEVPLPMIPQNHRQAKTASSASSASAQARPEIFQPLGRREEQTQTGGNTGPSFGTPAGQPLGHILPQPGSRANVSVFSSIPAVPMVPVPTFNKKSAGSDGFFTRTTRTAQAKQFDKRKQQTLATGQLIATPVGFGASIVDAMVVAGMGTLFLVSILFITKINLVGMLNNAATDRVTQVNLALLFAAVLQMYMLVARTFFGATFGEWAFDLQLGNQDQQLTFSYPLKVLWRSILVTMTGFLPIPLLSFITRRDLSRYVTGLQLYRKA